MIAARLPVGYGSQGGWGKILATVSRAFIFAEDSARKNSTCQEYQRKCFMGQRDD